MNGNFINEIREKAKGLNYRIAYPDAEDVRTLKTAKFILDNKLGQPVLVGNKESIENLAKKEGISLTDIQIIEPKVSPKFEEYTLKLFEKRKNKGMTLEQAQELIANPIYFAGMMLDDNDVQVVVGGNISATGDIIRSAIYTVGVAPGISIVSSYFIMVFPDKLLCFADCAVNPDPTAEQLADIAITSAKNFQSVTGLTPYVAMLSFSTKGSATHPHVDKVISATKIAKEKEPDLMIDGEMQVDAALIPSIGERKCKGSPVAGKANVLIFPDLDAGNIGYKLTERLAGAQAVGPIVQGLSKPYCDLSRGCSVDDMINVSCICSLMAKGVI
ncbi:MAG: phosphate acetyltransferase [Ignavibacteria bacterium]|nr:phosphate acetyltransferase [Ignavibacteria bacterium]